MKTTAITGLLVSALLVCGLVVVVHMALSGLDHIVVVGER